MEIYREQKLKKVGKVTFGQNKKSMELYGNYNKRLGFSEHFVEDGDSYEIPRVLYNFTKKTDRIIIEGIEYEFYKETMGMKDKVLIYTIFLIPKNPLLSVELELSELSQLNTDIREWYDQKAEKDNTAQKVQFENHLKILQEQTTAPKKISFFSKENLITFAVLLMFVWLFIINYYLIMR